MHHVPGRCAPFGRCPWTDVVVHAPRPRCRTSGKGVRFQRSGCRTANGQGVVFGRHIQFCNISACFATPSFPCLEVCHGMFSPLFWLFDLCFRGITVNLFRRQLLHLVGYVGICVQGSSAGYITQNCRQGLDVHSVGLGVGCKSMARTMKSHPFTSRIIQNSVQTLMGRGWTHGQVFFLWGWKHPS